MATFDMTAKSTTGVSASSIASLQVTRPGSAMRMVDAILDMDALTADSYSCTNGDIFQLLEIPANTFILFAGAEVLKVFDGTSPTVDIDFADVITGADSLFEGWITTTDTIDVKLIAGSADVSSGRLRVYACLVDVNGYAEAADEVDRDQLA